MAEDQRAALEEKCRSLDVPLLGVASAESWGRPPFQPFVPEAARPRSIMPEARSVVVIGIPLPMPAIESAPSIWYAETYRTVNLMLDQSAYRLALFLEDKGHASAYVPRDGYAGIEALRRDPTAFFSHRHAAVMAGLGTFGVNNAVLTREYGPRVRFTTVLTSAVVTPDDPIEEDLCIGCGACTRMCPASAIDGRRYPEGIIDKGACTEFSAQLRQRGISPCGMCVRICPVGEDRVLWGNRKISVYTDDKDRSQIWEHVRSHGVG